MKVGEYGGRTEARSVGSLIGTCLRETGMSRGLAGYKIGEAWDEVSKAAGHTLERTYRAGTLRVRLSSSVLRSELYRRLDRIREQINDRLSQDETFTACCPDPNPVRKIILL